MREFLQARQADNVERRLALAEGSPGAAVSLDLETYDRRRGAMLDEYGIVHRPGLNEELAQEHTRLRDGLERMPRHANLA